MENINTLALLQIAFTKMQAVLLSELHKEGFSDIKAVHGKVFAYIDMEKGSQPIELANKAETTKQFMSQLLIELEGLGYIKKVNHPSDNRAYIVKLTAKGKRSVLTAKQGLEKIEQLISTELSASEYDKFRKSLEKIMLMK